MFLRLTNQIDIWPLEAWETLWSWPHLSVIIKGWPHAIPPANHSSLFSSPPPPSWSWLFRYTCLTPPPPPLPVLVDSSSLMYTCPSPTYPPPPPRPRARHFRCTCQTPPPAVLAPTFPAHLSTADVIAWAPATSVTSWLTHFHLHLSFPPQHDFLPSPYPCKRRTDAPASPPHSLLSRISGKFFSIQRCGTTGRRPPICHRLEHGPIRREPAFKIKK